MSPGSKPRPATGAAARLAARRAASRRSGSDLDARVGELARGEGRNPPSGSPRARISTSAISTSTRALATTPSSLIWQCTPRAAPRGLRSRHGQRLRPRASRSSAFRPSRRPRARPRLRAPSASAPPETREETRARVAAALRGRGGCCRSGRSTAPPWPRRPSRAAPRPTPRWRPPGLAPRHRDRRLPARAARGPAPACVAAAHAGWRGTAAGVAARRGRGALARGSRPADLLAALGPGIGPCCYEVGDELREAFGPEGAAFFRRGRAAGRTSTCAPPTGRS